MNCLLLYCVMLLTVLIKWCQYLFVCFQNWRDKAALSLVTGQWWWKISVLLLFLRLLQLDFSFPGALLVVGSAVVGNTGQSRSSLLAGRHIKWNNKQTPTNMQTHKYINTKGKRNTQNTQWHKHLDIKQAQIQISRGTITAHQCWLTSTQHRANSNRQTKQDFPKLKVNAFQNILS